MNALVDPGLGEVCPPPWPGWTLPGLDQQIQVLWRFVFRPVLIGPWPDAPVPNAHPGSTEAQREAEFGSASQDQHTGVDESFACRLIQGLIPY